MKVAIGSDHGGFAYKEAVKKHLEKQGVTVVDVGPSEKVSVDYPSYGIAVGEKVSSGEVDYGVVVCTSGEGITIAANKVTGVIAGIGYNDNVAALLRLHNNANVIGFGQGEMELEDVLRRVDIFLETPFEGDRHTRRVQLIKDYENK